MIHPPTHPRSRAKTTTWGGLALAALVAAYSFARPIVNERMGWDFPAITGDNAAVVDSVPVGSTFNTAKESSTGEERPRKPGPLADKIPQPAVVENASKSRATPQTKKTPAPARQPSERTIGSNPQAVPQSSKSVSASSVGPEDTDLLYGILKDLGGERFVSPAGLMFTRGSAQGHRLDHLERHTEDDPGRPGKHGVFDGGMAGALKTIDRAYERAKTGSRTTKEVDQGRTIYTVDMGGRIGYIGGQDGNRQRKPMARRVRLVLDQNRVITAYPL